MFVNEFLVQKLERFAWEFLEISPFYTTTNRNERKFVIAILPDTRSISEPRALLQSVFHLVKLQGTVAPYFRVKKKGWYGEKILIEVSKISLVKILHMNTLILISPPRSLNFKPKSLHMVYNYCRIYRMVRQYCRITEWSENVNGGCSTPTLPKNSVYDCRNNTLTVGVYFKVLPDVCFQKHSLTKRAFLPLLL